MRIHWLSLAFLVAVALPAAAQEERLWMPEGYRLLSLEERQELSADELKAIHSKNISALEAALAPLSSSERAALAQELERFRQAHALSDTEKQYVTIVSMRLLAGAVQDQKQQEREAEKVYQKLLRDQEETTRGFAADQKSVEAEAAAVEAQMDKEDSRKLYLRILRPLRARPWNDFARVIFRRLVRYDFQPGSRTLYDAALIFLRSRQAEAPEQGSWFSLEAFLRLSLRGEVVEAKRLFSIAIVKEARDFESYVYPLLIAEIEGNEPERARLLARARKIWSREKDLDFELFRQLPFLPPDLQVRARATFERRYKSAHPSDWASRIELLERELRDGRMRAVEDETTALLSLSVSVLPQPHRSEIFLLNLRAKVRLGQCDEVAAQIPNLERNAEAAYPRELDPEAPPVPRAARDVRQMRASLKDRRRELEMLKAALADESLDGSTKGGGISKEQRADLAKDIIPRLEDDLRQLESLPFAEDDVKVAAEWSTRELQIWERAHKILENENYDLFGRAERLSIFARSEVGKCLLAQRKPLAAVGVLKPCIGRGHNFHMDCIFPLIDAGVALAEQGRVQDAVAIYERVSPGFVSTEKLYEAIEKASPGLVKRFVPTPMKPVALPTPFPK